MVCAALKGKNCIITGANSGIGKKLSIELGRLGANIIMMCRNKEKAFRVQNEIINESKNSNIDLLICDISLKKSVYDSISVIKEKYGHIDILINNAGILLFEKEYTSEGIEKTLATNYLGPFLLSNGIIKTNDPERSCKIINIVSEGTNDNQFDFSFLYGMKKYNGIKSYSFSKQAEIFFTFELAKRFKNTQNTVNCFYPGLVKTNLGKPDKGFFRLTYNIMSRVLKSKFIPIEESIRPAMFLLCSEKASKLNGCYLKKQNGSVKVIRQHNSEVSAELWRRTVKLIM